MPLYTWQNKKINKEILTLSDEKLTAEKGDYKDFMSKEINEHKVKWDGDLVCSLAWNKDGERLSPENGTCLYHTFVVHKELFQGLD